MDYTQVNIGTKAILLRQGINPDIIDNKYQLYYDETNNIKKLQIRENGCTNVPIDTIFVIGGIEGSGEITLEELKKRFNLQDNVKEVKSHHIYKGTFPCCLKSKKLESYLDLLLEKGWHFHFQSLNLLYWSIVDILDSIEGFSSLPPDYVYALKATLYQVAKNNQFSIIQLMLKYSYPDIKDEFALKSFFKELLHLVTKHEFANNPKLDLLKEGLKIWLQQGITQAEAIFIQDEQENVLLSQLTSFYICEIYTWKNSRLFMDNESDIAAELDRMSIKIDDKIVNNFSFVDSIDNTMVQLSDVAVGIIAKYLQFIDQNGYNLPDCVAEFDDRQKIVLKKLNKILKESIEFNPAFFHQTNSIEFNSLFIRYIEHYHKTNLF